MGDAELSAVGERRLLEAVVLVASELELPVMLQRIADMARELVHARYGALGVLGHHGRLSQFITSGLDEGEIRAIGKLPEGHGVLGLLITEARPLRIGDLSTHPASYGFPQHHPAMRSFLGVPILARGIVFGNLYLTEKVGADEFNGEDEEFAAAFAAAAGVAIENARLHEAREKLVMLEDRERIARDLHDTVIQRLFATGMALQATANLAQHPELETRIERAVAELDDTIHEIRSTIFALTPSSHHQSLRNELLAMVGSLTDVLGFRPRLQLHGPVDTIVAPPLSGHVVSVVREALSNVARHSKAKRVDVVVMATATEVVVRVTDNGVGVPPLAGAKGNGIRNMQSRAEVLGGGCIVEAVPSGGTCVEWRALLE